MALGREAIGAELPSAGLWLNASKPEALLETTMIPFLASDDRLIYTIVFYFFKRETVDYLRQSNGLQGKPVARRDACRSGEVDLLIHNSIVIPCSEHI